MFACLSLLHFSHDNPIVGRAQTYQGQRAVVTFSDPEDALLAFCTKHKQVMGKAPVFLTLLP